MLNINITPFIMLKSSKYRPVGFALAFSGSGVDLDASKEPS